MQINMSLLRQKYAQYFLLIFSCFFFSLSSLELSAQTWKGGGTSLPAGYEPVEMDNVFKPGSVNKKDVLDRANFFSYVEDEVVIMLEHNMDAATARRYYHNYNFSQLVKNVSFTTERVILTHKRNDGKSVSLVHLKITNGINARTVIESIPFEGEVLWASFNFKYQGDMRELTPNDPLYGDQWHHVKMQNNLAWDIQKGSPSVIVAVLDDGVHYTHPDLAEGIWINTGEIAGDGIDNDGNGFIDDVYGWDFSSNNNNPSPNDPTYDQHGTHVAGIINAQMDNNIGLTGVAPHSKVMAVQFYGVGSWTSTVVANSYTYSVDNGAKILNVSYNIDGFMSDPIFFAGADYVHDNGVLYFNSAGNNNEFNPLRQKATQALLVASTTSTDARSSFSNYGEGIDVSSPGSFIYSTIPTSSYAAFDGTSMATPNAAGVAALIWSQFPSWNHYQVAAQLLGTADDISAQNPSFVNYLGSGRVNSYKALTQTLPHPRVSVRDLPAHGSVTANEVTKLSLKFNQVMHPAGVNNMSNYDFRSAGPNGVFGDGDDVVYPLTISTTYRLGTNWNDYVISESPLPCGSYRLTINATNVKNPFNQTLDGNEDGVGGDNFVYEFTLGSLKYQDSDNDGYGVTHISQHFPSCGPVAGWADVAGDCNDNDPAIHPNADEICNGIDDNCDGYVDAKLVKHTFSFNQNILIPVEPNSRVASINPAIINVPVLEGDVKKVEVSLKGISHTYFSDIDMLLESPEGNRFKFLSDALGNANISNFNLTLSDDGLSLSMPITNGGIYKPYNSGGDDFFYFPNTVTIGMGQSAAPNGTATFTSSFMNANPTGEWKLYIVDDANLDDGSMSGWDLILYVLDTTCLPPTPTELPAPTFNVVHAGCAQSYGSIEILSPVEDGYEYTIGSGWQNSPYFGNLAPGTYIIQVRDENGVMSSTVQVVVESSSTVPSEPTALIGERDVCRFEGTGENLTYKVDPAEPGVTYTWTLPPTMTLISGQGTEEITVQINIGFAQAANKQIKVAASNACGSSGVKIFYLQAQAPVTPSPIVASATNVCDVSLTGTAISYTINKVPGAASYEWVMNSSNVTITHPNGPGVNDTVIHVVYHAGATSRTLQVRAVNPCGISAFRSTNIQINGASMPGLISGPTSICNYVGPDAALATYTVPNMDGVEFEWILPAGCTDIDQNGNQINFRYPANFNGGSISVIASNACGVSPARSLNVSALLPGAPGPIDGVMLEDCPNKRYSFSIANVPSHTSYLQWSVPVGAQIVSGQGTSSIVVEMGSSAVSGTVTVTAVNNCGSSSTRKLSVKMSSCENVSPQFVNFEKDVIDIYPNPTTGWIYLTVAAEVKDKVEVRLKDAKGQLLHRTNVKSNTTNYLKIEGVPGVYFVELIYNKKRAIKKVIKL